MAEATQDELDRIPDYTKINQFSEEEFRIHKINERKNLLWVTHNNLRISFILSHIDPESDLGDMVQQLPDHVYATISAVRLSKGKEHMPRWYLTEISNLRVKNNSNSGILR